MNSTSPAAIVALLETFAAEHRRSDDAYREYREIRGKFIQAGSGETLRSVAGAGAALGEALEAGETAFLQALGEFEKLQAQLPDATE